MSKIKFAKNGQWAIEKSEDEDSAHPRLLPNGEWHPEYVKEAENHLKGFYSHSPAAQEYLRNNLWNVPAHYRNAKNFSDWKVSPMHSVPTKTLVAQIKPEAKANSNLTINDLKGHSGPQSDIEHRYQVHYKDKPMGDISAYSHPESGGGSNLDPDLRNHPQYHKLLDHLHGEAFLHHVNTRIAKPKGLN